MSVSHAICEADALLPGEPVEEGPDPRWQAIIRIGEFVESDPEQIWEFVLRWGSHPQEDLRVAIATCLLEHLLEHHFDTYFPQVEQAARQDILFADTFQRCWPFGQAEKDSNWERIAMLRKQLS